MLDWKTDFICRAAAVSEKVWKKRVHCCFSVIAVSASSIWLILNICQMISSGLFFLILVIFGFYCLSVRSLIDAALQVRKHLETNDLPGARKELSMIVGRGTDNIDEEGVVYATVETVAEIITDWIVLLLMHFFQHFQKGKRVAREKSIKKIEV